MERSSRFVGVGYLVSELEGQQAGGTALAVPTESKPAPAWRRQLVADLGLLLVTAIWGTTFVVVKEVLQTLPPFTFIALRFTLGTATLAAVFGGRLRSLTWPEARAGILVGVFLFAGFAFQTLGLQVTPASTAGFITGLSVVLVPVAAYFWLRQRPSTGAVVGVCAAAAGLGLLSIRDDLSLAPGDVLVLLCAIAFALHIVAVGKFAPRMDALALTLVQLGFVGVVSWAVALTAERPAVVLTPPLVGTLLFVGVVATALVFCIQNVAQRFTSPTHTALIFTMEPVFAAFFAYVWLAEQLGGRAAVGAVLILAGMLAAELRRNQR